MNTSTNKFSTDCDSHFIEYVIGILNDSRSKKHALIRLYGLLQKKRETEQGCIVYNKEMISEYENRNKTAEETNPPRPPISVRKIRTRIDYRR